MAAAKIDEVMENEKKAFKDYLLSKKVSVKSANVAVSKAFGLWKLKSKEAFDKLMKSENFEKDAKEELIEIYNGNEKKAAAYYSELKRYYIYYLEKNNLPVPKSIQNSKPGRKPSAAKKTTAKKATAKKATTKKAAAKKPAAKKTAAKKPATKKPAAAKPAAKKAGRPAAKKVGRPAAKKVGRPAAKKTAAAKKSTAPVQNYGELIKALKDLNKALAPISKLAEKFR